MTRRARCCCGGCSVEVQGDPEVSALCHCDDCKRRTGSAFGWSAYFADERIVGRSGDYGLYRVERGNQRRWFCAACGSTLLLKSDGRDGQIGIAGGCFVDPPLPEPTVTVSNDGRCAWLGLPGDWRTAL
jgi:hypothetical protein